jgi:hypothetical protein
MRKLKTLFAVAGIAALAACGTKEAPGPLEPTSATGRIRFVNLITDATRVPVNPILEGVPFGAGLTYTQSPPSILGAPSTANYAPIYAGSRTLILKKTADTSVTVATIALTITADQDLSVYATGGASASAIVPVFITDDNTGTVGATQTRLRTVNMSSGGAVDVFVTAANADLSLATPTFANVASHAGSTYANVTAGTYQIRVVPAGTAAAARAGAVSLNLTAVVFTGGTGRTIVVADKSTGGPPLTGFVLPDR